MESIAPGLAPRQEDRLLDAATATFASGEPVRLEAVARGAGVGIGMLCCHFPTREALVEAVYRGEIDRLETQVDERLGQHPADAALRAWMSDLEAWIVTKREMVETLRGLMSSGAIEHSEMRARLAEMIERLLRAGAADGTVRGDVLASLTGIFLASGNDQQAQSARMLDLLMDGLRPRPVSRRRTRAPSARR